LVVGCWFLSVGRWALDVGRSMFDVLPHHASHSFCHGLTAVPSRRRTGSQYPGCSG
jgi:hypothetical protein